MEVGSEEWLCVLVRDEGKVDAETGRWLGKR